MTGLVHDPPPAAHLCAPALRLGDVVVHRARPQDALAYAQADAQMVSNTYRDLMPPQFEQRRIADIPTAARQRARIFSDALEAEARGAEPALRTWIAWRGSEVGGIVATTRTQPEWERELGVPRLDGIELQLNHLYLRPWAHGTGLGQAMLDLALPPGEPAYLWLIAGNDRAERFYSRNGFRREPVEYSCGPSWFDKPMHRLIRDGAAESRTGVP